MFQNGDAGFCEMGFTIVVAKLTDGNQSAVLQVWKSARSSCRDRELRQVEQCCVRSLDDWAVRQFDFNAIVCRGFVGAMTVAFQKMAGAAGVGASCVVMVLGVRVGRQQINFVSKI